MRNRVPPARRPRRLRPPRPPRPRRRRTGSPEEAPELPSAKPLEILNSVAGAASFVVGLMLYAGFTYINAYYGYFRVSVLSLGLGSFEFVLRSLRLVTLPALAVLAAVLLVPYVPELVAALRIPERWLGRARTGWAVVVRLHPLYVVAGVALILLWRRIEPFGWTAPLLIAVGFLLGRSRTAVAARPARRAAGRRAVAVVVAGTYLMWVIALAAGRLGVSEARDSAAHLERRVSVVLFSADRLTLNGPGVEVTDLRKYVHYRVHLRYRYTGLRLLVERGGRYYLLPVGWRRAADPTYVFETGPDLRVELRPGTRQG